MPHDPTGPRRPYRGRQVPAHWPEPPRDFSPTFGVPKSDTTKWWRLEPAKRDSTGTVVGKAILHGGTCSRWPGIRVPPGWEYLTKPEARAALERPDVISCRDCRRAWGSVFWPREGTGPVVYPDEGG